MGRKKIILLASSDINYDQRIQRIASSLHEMGAEVHVLGRKLPASVALQNRAFKQDRVTCIFNKGVLFYLELNLRFFLHLLVNSYDTVCANDPDTLIAAIKAKLFKNFDLIYDSHEYFTEVPELEGKPFKKKIWGAIERNGVKKAKRCYTVNESLAKIFKEKYGADFQVVRNVPILKEKESELAKEGFILYQGALNKGRGLEELINAMVHVPLNLKIAGKGDLSQGLFDLVDNLALNDKVEFVGNLLPNELSDITKKAWLGINILESSSLNYYYSLANKFFDYMHAEIPSLNMAFPEYEAILSKWEVGVTLIFLSQKDIAKAINSLLQDEERYQEMKSNCKLAKKEFNWQKEKEKLREIYSLQQVD